MKRFSKTALSLLLILVLVGCSSGDWGMSLDKDIKHSFTIKSTGLTNNTYYVVDRSVFGYDSVLAHDRQRLFASLQGLINRVAEKNDVVLMLLPENENETTLVEYLKNDGGILKDKERKDIKTWDEFLTTFKNQFIQCGMVLWDTKVPATANVAATMCGVEGCLPVKDIDGGVKADLEKLGVKAKQTLTDKFTGNGKIADTEIDSTGSTKNDAYIWAMEKYMDKCSKHYIMFVPDGASSVPGNEVCDKNFESKRIFGNDNIICHDYGIARQMFFVDLNPMTQYVPVDDKTQKEGTDAETLKKILDKRYENAKGEFGCMVGMPPWQVKYSDYQNMGVVSSTELKTEFVKVITNYNMYLDASGLLSNCSAYYQFKLKSKYNNGNKKTKVKYEKNTLYVCFQVGSYETSKSLVDDLMTIYKDEKNGEIPLAWAINPGLADRMPVVFDYVYNDISKNNVIVASNGGVGYINSNELFLPKDGEKSPSSRTNPAGADNFVKVSKEYFEKFDIDMISHLSGRVNDDIYALYNQIAPKGIFHNDYSQSSVLLNGVGYYPAMSVLEIGGEKGQAADSMYNYWKSHGAGSFICANVSRWTPTQLIELKASMEEVWSANKPDWKVKVVSAYDFMNLATEAGVLVAE